MDGDTFILDGEDLELSFEEEFMIWTGEILEAGFGTDTVYFMSAE